MLNMWRDMPQPYLTGALRRLRWLFGFTVYDWDRERWTCKADIAEAKRRKAS